MGGGNGAAGRAGGGGAATAFGSVAGPGGGGSGGMSAATDVDVGGPLIAGPAGSAEGCEDEEFTTLIGTREGSLAAASGRGAGIGGWGADASEGAG